MSKPAPVINGRNTFRSYVSELSRGDVTVMDETVESIRTFNNGRVHVYMTNGATLGYSNELATILLWEDSVEN